MIVTKLFKANTFFRALFFSIVISIGFFGVGYFLSPNKKIFLGSADWIYQLFWFPLHAVLAYWSMVNYKRSTENIRHVNITFKYIWGDFFSNRKDYFLAVLMVAPFIIEDTIEGLKKFSDGFNDFGYSTLLMIGPVWVLEWLFLGVIWSQVIRLAYMSVKKYSLAYVQNNINEILANPSSNKILAAGEVNALINLIYGLSAFGYIMLCDGESSDYQTTAISAFLVLFSFLTSFVILRFRINQALVRLSNDFYESIPADINERLSVGPSKVLIDSELLEFNLFGGANNLGVDAHQRVNKVRLAFLINSALKNGSCKLDLVSYMSASQYIQNEINFAKFGHRQLYVTCARLSVILIAFVDKAPLLGKLMS